MRFYQNNSVLFLWMEEEVSKLIGPIGTRVSLKPANGTADKYLITPDPLARSRLHMCKAKYAHQETPIEVSFKVDPKDWKPIGRTELPYEVQDGKVYILPGQAEHVDVREVPFSNRRVERREHSQLPLDLPPKPEAEQLARLKRRSMVGVPSDLDELKAAKELLNDALSRLPENFSVEITILPGPLVDIEVTTTVKTKL